jgi:hypothetical protein
MDSETLKNMAINIGTNSAVIVGMSALGISDAIKNTLGNVSNAEFVGYGAEGLSYGAGLDIKNGFMYGPGASNLYTMNYRDFLDHAAFLGLCSLGANKSGLVTAVATQGAKISPLPPNMTSYLIQGGLVSGAEALGVMADQYASDTIIHKVRHPSKFLYA